MFSSPFNCIPSQKPTFLCSNSAVKVPDLQTYRNMEMTKEGIGFTFDLRNMLLSLQTGIPFERAAAACAILEGTFGFGPFVKQLLRGICNRSLLQYLASSLYLDLPLDVIGAGRIQWSIKSC